jgi:hypothetical protein
MNILSTANVILTLLPIITDTVKNVEAAVGSGNGAQKKDLAIGIIKSIYEASNPPVAFDAIVSHITEVIAAVVTFYNSIKAFPKAVQQAAA